MWRMDDRAEVGTDALRESVWRFAERVFGSEDAAQDWLLSPHMLLGGKPPILLASSESGLRKIESMLAALEYGFPV